MSSIYDSWRKILCSNNVDQNLVELMHTKEANDLYHEIEDMKGCEQQKSHHPEGDVWTHTRMSCNAMIQCLHDPLDSDHNYFLMLSIFLHDVGKPLSPKDGHGHDRAGIDPGRKFLRKIGCPADVEENVLNIIRNHMWIHENSPFPTVSSSQSPSIVSDKAFKRLLERLEPATMHDLALVSSADERGRWWKKNDYRTNEYTWFMKRVKEMGLK